jgi:hypothetical protein
VPKAVSVVGTGAAVTTSWSGVGNEATDNCGGVTGETHMYSRGAVAAATGDVV